MRSAIQRNIVELDKNLSLPVQVKIGFHSGPVIAVNANDILDYFGRTVNLAARVQQESIGNDIVMNETIYSDLLQQPEVVDLMCELRYREILETTARRCGRFKTHPHSSGLKKHQFSY